MNKQDEGAKKQAGVQAGAGAAEESKAGGPIGVPSEEVGRGAGLDPQDGRDKDRDADAGEDEAFADRPTRRVEPEGADAGGAAIQRPPSDS